MTWNYRVIQFGTDLNTYRAIHEVYYDNDGKLSGYSESPVGITWDVSDGYMNNKEALVILDMMKQALDKPFLLPSDFHE